MKSYPLNCWLCGRWVGKDGDTDVMYDDWSGAYEVGYPRCGRCCRKDETNRLPSAARAEREGSRA